MVQVLESNPTFAQQIGRATGGVLGKGAAEVAENLALKQRGIDVSGLSGYARDVAIKEGTKRAMMLQQGQRTLAPAGGQQPTPATQGIQPVSGTPAEPGQQPVTQAITGTEKRFIPPEQIEQEAIRRGQAKISRGEPTDLQTEVGLIQQENANVAQHEQRQQQYGDFAQEEFEKAFSSAKPEEIASFRRKGEEYAKMGLAPSQVQKQLAKDARVYANEVKRLRNVPGVRMHAKVHQFYTGTGEKDEARKQTIRRAAQPFLDRGEHSVVRNNLSSKGYGPEEIESIISDLSEQTKKSLNEFGNVKPSLLNRAVKREVGVEDPSYRAFKNNPEGQQKFATSLQDTLQKDPNANLLLLRKAYEDKGVDWNTFKNEFNNIIENGQFSPNDEQSKMLEYIDEPPLNRLEKIMADLNWWGR